MRAHIRRRGPARRDAIDASDVAHVQLGASAFGRLPRSFIVLIVCEQFEDLKDMVSALAQQIRNNVDVQEDSVHLVFGV